MSTCRIIPVVLLSVGEFGSKSGVFFSLVSRGSEFGFESQATSRIICLLYEICLLSMQCYINNLKCIGIMIFTILSNCSSIVLSLSLPEIPYLSYNGYKSVPSKQKGSWQPPNYHYCPN